jgi:hypothetical protein
MNSHVLAGYTLHDIEASVREVFHVAEDVVIYAFALWALIKYLFFRAKDDNEAKPG